MGTRRSSCPHCSRRRRFDAQAAIRRLAKQHQQLADCLMRDMDEAALKRPKRVASAANISQNIAEIVGGRPVLPGTFPECCLIGSVVNDSRRWFCTGALIHPRVVVTAAHCHSASHPADIVALNADDESALENAEIILARRTSVDPRHLSSPFHDVAVLVLRRAAEVTPAKIATTAEINAATETTLVGFGNDDVHSTRGFGKKREVTVPVRAIRRDPAEDLDGEEIEFGFESDFEFVAGGDGFDSCNGDSGGPAYIEVDGDHRLAGLTARGFEASATVCGEGGIYSRIDANLDFIRSAAAESGIDLPV
jgi:secreted trypsin-like serine protease